MRALVVFLRLFPFVLAFVWDRRRFQLLWGWEYKLEAYVPPGGRSRGHYAMPMLWDERMIGWANLKVVDGRLRHRLGFIDGRPRDRRFQHALDDALHRMREFLGLRDPQTS